MTAVYESLFGGSAWMRVIVRSLAAYGLLVCVAAPGALAQTSAPSARSSSASASNDAALEEIVVTAEFRQQSLQDVPLAISSVTGSMIESRSLTTIADVGSAAPNVDIRPAGAVFGPASQITIRGIGQGDTSFALEPGVGTYVDDVYFSTVFGSIFELLDLDRVEILRGPQGTLEGQNSIGGAVKLFTKKPDGQNDAYLEGTVGSFKRKDLRGASDFTLIPDKLFVRVTGLVRARDGYVKDLDYGCLHPGSGVPTSTHSADCILGTQGGEQVAAARIALRWLPTEQLEVNISADDSNTRDEPTPSELTYATTNGRYFASGTPFGPQFIPSNLYTTYATYSDPGGIYNGVKLTSSGYSIPSISRVDDAGVSGTVDYKLMPELTLRSISAYRKYQGQYASDADASPFDFQNVFIIQNHEQASEELRLIGNALDSKVNYVLGGFYFNAHDLQGGRVQYPSLFDFVQNDPVISTTKAGYAHLEWNPFGGLHLLGGIRYSSLEKSYTFSRIDPSTGQPPFILAAINGQSSTFSGSHVDYNANLQYRWTPELMTYVQWSTGFRSGGINERPFYANQVVPFQPETLDNYELGLKSDLLDHALRINLAAFYDNYHNVLLTAITPYFNTSEPVNTDPASPGFNPPGGTFPAAVTENAGEATIKGVEAEIATTPIKALEITASGSYIDFTYKSLTAEALASGVTLRDKPPLTPKYKGSLSAQYSFGLPDGSKLVPRLDFQYQAQMFAAASQTPYDSIPAYGLLNGRLTWTSASANSDVALFVTNIADRFYWLNKFDSVSLAGIGLGTPGRPREWGLSYRRRF